MVVLSNVRQVYSAGDERVAVMDVFGKNFSIGEWWWYGFKRHQALPESF